VPTSTSRPKGSDYFFLHLLVHFNLIRFV
jgi:hypothetical protein